jgi:hypothetical protein
MGVEEPSQARRTTAEFTIALQPSEGLLAGTGRFDFTKTWSGGMAGTSQGLMLTAGDPQGGFAGYVALETFDGVIDGRRGRVVLQQFGTMAGGESVLHYELVPGSGTRDLAGIHGVVDLQVDDGDHRVTLTYRDARP